MATTTTTTEKPVVVVGVDNSEQSVYALEWVLDHFFVPHAPNSPFQLYVVYAKPSVASVNSAYGFAGAGFAEGLPLFDSELKKMAAKVIEQAKQACLSKSVNDATLEIMEGDPRNALCDAVYRHNASMLVVGSHGYGTIKRAVLGSVSDYCAHHAHCSVLIVKRPKIKH